MAKKPRISNPYSTGGGGYNFEYLVGTYYLISMLKKSIPLGLEEGEIEKVKFQAKYDGHFLDDIVLICSNNCSLSIQVRRKVKFTERDTEFKSIIIECYKNFSKDSFNPNSDRNNSNKQQLLFAGSDDLRYCIACGKANDSVGSFCKYCGNQL